MNALKFNEQKVLNCIAAYHDEHGDYPYLIMNEKMMKNFQKSMEL